MAHTMGLTLAEAAQATGLNRSTVLRAIKSGKISGTRDGNGNWSVEPVELFRVFPPADATPKAMPQDAQALAAAAATDALVAELRAVIADLRQDRDQWREQAQRLALPSMPEHKPAAASRRPWWRRLAG
jgi:excisionase family DNA binding protein